MVTEKVSENQKQSEEEISSSESDDSEIEFNYNDEEDDDDDDDSCEDENDDIKTQDTESEESETMETPSPRKKKRKKQKTDKLRNGDDDDDSNDAGDEDDDDDIRNDNKMISKQPRKKKRKMTKSSNTDDDDDDDVSEDEEVLDDDDDDSEEEVSHDDDDDDDDDSEEEASENNEKEEEEASENDEEEEEEKVRTGFANVLSNILSKKTVSSKKVILAQGKTDREIMKHKENQIPLEERESKEPVLTAEELEEQKLKRKVWLEMGRVKPNPLERNREKELKMIATRGVVQLFNAVKKQQKMMTENLSNVSSERKRDLVIESMNKKSFINLLQNTKVDVSLQPMEKEKTDAEESERKIWNVLKDDFVIGTGKMKDWDKQDNLEDL